MTEQELAEIAARLTDGEPLVSLSERTYIAEIQRLLAEVRRLRTVCHNCGEPLFCPCGVGLE